MPTQTVNRVTLHYQDHGQGVPVVLLHGFPLDRRMWDAQLPALVGGYRVITPDFRGFGQSDGGDAPFTIDDLADDVHGLLTAIGALPCILGGLSMGGYVSFSFARRYPKSLQGLMLFDTRADADSSATREARQKSIELVREKGSPAIAEQMVPKLLAPGAAEGRPDVARSVRQMAEACPAKTIEHALAALRDRPDAASGLPLINVPTLIVVGDGDQITPPTLAAAMQKAIPGSTMTIIRGAGHMSPVEQPGQVNQAIVGFLQKLK